MTKRQDIVIALKLCLAGGERSFAVFAGELGIGASKVHGVPFAAKRDPALYDHLARVDALRIGRAREWKFAQRELERLLSQDPVSTRRVANG